MKIKEVEIANIDSYSSLTMKERRTRKYQFWEHEKFNMVSGVFCLYLNMIVTWACFNGKKDLDTKQV